MKKKRWTHQEIQILENNYATKLISELETLLSGRSRDAILSKIKNMGLSLPEIELIRRMKLGRSLVKKTNFKLDQNLKLEELDRSTLQVILGSMLGDGCCNRQSKNMKHHRFCESHCLKQKDYAEWKSEKLSVFKPRFYVWKYYAQVITLSHPIFDELREKFYLPNISCKSIIPLKLIDKLDLLGLMIWYLDDGYMRRSGHQMGISAKGWHKNGLVKVSNMLNQKFKLSTYVYSCSHNNGENRVLKFPAKDKLLLSEFKKLSLVHNVPECMKYKF